MDWPSVSNDSDDHSWRSNGWAVSDGDRTFQSYSAEQIRISILWKAPVEAVDDADDDRKSLLTPEGIVPIFGATSTRAGSA
jgi:hypothetical protein